MDAIRIDEARRLLRLAAPEQRGLRSVYLNTRTGRRKYWTRWVKPEPKEKNATTLGLRKDKVRIAPDFFQDKVLPGGDEIGIDVKSGEMAIFVNGDLNASGAKNPVRCAIALRDMVSDYISSLPDGTVINCTAFDARRHKQDKKQDLYKVYGFGDSGEEGRLFGFVKDGKLFPIDKEWMNKNYPKGYRNLGYDSDGYDRNGYDRNGYDEDGYDADGFDEDGYDRAGHPMHGV